MTKTLLKFMELNMVLGQHDDLEELINLTNDDILMKNVEASLRVGAVE